MFCYSSRTNSCASHTPTTLRKVSHCRLYQMHRSILRSTFSCHQSSASKWRFPFCNHRYTQLTNLNFAFKWTSTYTFISDLIYPLWTTFFLLDILLTNNSTVWSFPPKLNLQMNCFFDLNIHARDQTIPLQLKEHDYLRFDAFSDFSDLEVLRDKCILFIFWAILLHDLINPYDSYKF